MTALGWCCWSFRWRAGLCSRVNRVPRRRGFEARVHVVDVLLADSLQPFVESRCAFFDIDGNAVFPCGAAAEDAGEFGAGFGGEFQAELKGLVADAFAQINEGQR